MSPKVMERLVGAAYQRWVASVMAAPVPRDRYRHLQATVIGVEDVAPAVRRVTLHGLADYVPNGPDEYLGLFLPRAGRPIVLPEAGDLRVQAALARIPEAERPELRWYTLRAQRGSEVDIDIVRHGDEGPGTAWAGRVAVGDQVGVREGSAAYRPPGPAGHQLIVADETALPALAGIIEFANGEPGHPWHNARAIVEIPDDDHATPLPQARFEVSVHRRSGAPGSGFLPALESLEPLSVTSAWVCAEAGAVATARRHLIKDVGVDKRALFYSGYWKLGRARG